MLTEVKDRIATGSISNVIKFGDPLMDTPYVCVKPETMEVGRQLRVIVHFDQGKNDELDDYIFNELPSLLSNWSYTDEYGNYVTVKDSKEYTDIVADNDDNSISMERLFYIPLKL